MDAFIGAPNAGAGVGRVYLGGPMGLSPDAATVLVGPDADGSRFGQWVANLQ